MKKVAVFDSDETMRSSLKFYFRDRGYDVQASSGSDAVRMLGKFSPDLVVVDMKAAGNSGLELVNAILEEQRSRKIPVLIMAHDQDANAGIQKFPNAQYIDKPFTLDQIRVRVDALLRTIF